MWTLCLQGVHEAVRSGQGAGERQWGTCRRDGKQQMQLTQFGAFCVMPHSKSAIGKVLSSEGTCGHLACRECMRQYVVGKVQVRDAVKVAWMVPL